MRGRSPERSAGEPAPVTTSPWPHRLSRLLPIATLVALLPLLLRGITRGELYLNTDEPLHAVGGLFFADVLRDLPLTEPIQYAYRWYAQYPALGLIHWPPGFYLLEGVFFRLFGPSAPVARLAVIAFAALGLLYWFRLVALLLNRRAAAAAMVLLACSPSLLLFEQSVMLEVPALSLCLAASFYWIRYIRAVPARPGDAYRFAVCAAAALLTKQHSMYLVPFCLFTLLAERRWALLLARPTVSAIALITFLAGPFYVLALVLHGDTIRADLLQGTVPGARLTFYPEVLPVQLGIPLLTLSLIGIATSPWSLGIARARPMLMWIIACYAMFTWLAQRDARYIIYWIPAFVFFAVAPLAAGRSAAAARRLGVVLVTVVVAYQAWWASRYERPYVAGYEAAVQRLTRHAAPGFVLFDGELHGNFIFYFRIHDPRRQGVVLRKQLYVTRVMHEYGSRELLRERADIEEMLARYGVRYVVVDNSAPRFASQRILREILAAPPFILAGTYPVDSNLARFRERTLLVYEHPSPPAPRITDLRLPMLTLPYDIRVPLAELPPN